MTDYSIDGTDRKILSLLVGNARMPYMEVARLCGISGPAVHQRVRKMEQFGVIAGTQLRVKPSAVGLSVCAFVNVSLTEASHYPEVISALKHVPEIVECHFVTGRHALLLKIYCEDNSHLMDIVMNTIQRIPHVSATDTAISLEEAFERQVWVGEKSPKAQE